MLIYDLDRFKSINDQFGHLGGDFALREMTACVKKTIRREDLFARFGGEEFAIVLPRTNLRQGVIVADQIRNAVMRRKFVGKATREDLSAASATAATAKVAARIPTVARFMAYRRRQ